MRIGQIDLPAEVRCRLGDAVLRSKSVSTLSRLTGDWELALTALVVRRIESELVDVDAGDILAAERRVVAARFGGSGAAYRTALSRAGASLPIARGVLGDELRRLELRRRFRVGRPSAATVGRYLETHAVVPARAVTASPAPSWLPEGAGVALGTSAPPGVFRIPGGRSVRVLSVEGPLTLQALDDTTSLGALPLSVARPAAVRELDFEQRAQAYADWTLRRQRGAESRLACQKDRLPEIGIVDLSTFAPFLALREGTAG